MTDLFIALLLLVVAPTLILYFVWIWGGREQETVSCSDHNLPIIDGLYCPVCYEIATQNFSKEQK
jgi:hypothetical protein